MFQPVLKQRTEPPREHNVVEIGPEQLVDPLLARGLQLTREYAHEVLVALGEHRSRERGRVLQDAREALPHAREPSRAARV